MTRHPHTLSDGTAIIIELKRSAQKNLILRPVDTQTLSINVPPRFPNRALTDWLTANEAILRKTLAKAAGHPAPDGKLPARIWYRGERTDLGIHDRNHILATPSGILLPDQDTAVQTVRLRRFLHERAREYLLPRLANHAAATGLTPAAAALTNAKTFWGVCRTRTGIRLNWRLVGAPGYVADYVCIHELSHLRHPDHSPRFWQLVNSLTPHTENAKNWLKTHGSELFVLG